MLFSVKSHLVWLLIGEKCAQIKQCLWVKTALNKYVGGFWRQRITGDGLFQWWKRYYGFKLLCFLTKSNGLKLKHLNDGFSCKHAAFGFTRRWLIDGLEWCGLLVNVLIRCLDSHSDGTHSLQSIHCWSSEGLLHFSKSDEERNSSTSCMAWGWAHFQPIFTFGWTIPLNTCCDFEEV